MTPIDAYNEWANTPAPGADSDEYTLFTQRGQALGAGVNTFLGVKKESSGGLLGFLDHVSNVVNDHPFETAAAFAAAVYSGGASLGSEYGGDMVLSEFLPTADAAGLGIEQIGSSVGVPQVIDVGGFNLQSVVSGAKELGQAFVDAKIISNNLAISNANADLALTQARNSVEVKKIQGQQTITEAQNSLAEAQAKNDSGGASFVAAAKKSDWTLPIAAAGVFLAWLQYNKTAGKS